MSLTEIDRHWREHLSGDRCPPVLGLAPAMDDEIDQLSILLKPGGVACPKGDPRELIRNLQLYPAATALWLVSMSARAYHDGNFWDNLAIASGFSVYANQRADLVMTLRRACQKVMSHFTLPPRDSSFKYVAELLFQAGLPLCHAGPFAEAVRRVERQVGLPDLSDPAGPEWLRDEALRRVNPGLKTLSECLSGPAGPIVCEAVLNFLLREDLMGLGQALQRELERVFGEASKRGELRRSARPPYLSLGADAVSLEIVGPEQDTSLFQGSGPRWVVAGRAHRVAANEALRVHVNIGDQVEVQLTGLASGTASQTKFDLDLTTKPRPLWLFDTETHRQKRLPEGTAELTLQGGEYLVVHPSVCRISDAEDVFIWEDEKHATSRVKIRPGTCSTLESESGEALATLTAKSVPIVEWAGPAIVAFGGERLYRGSETKLSVWIPEHARELEWGLCLRHEGQTLQAPLTVGEESLGGFSTAHSEQANVWLKALEPGLWSIDVQVVRQKRIECSGQVWIWQGLGLSLPGGGWNLQAKPNNLKVKDGAGFQITAHAAYHIKDASRLHYLAFEIDGQIKRFCWQQEGLFIESFQRVPGVPSQFVSHRLGESFVAEPISDRWIRVWSLPHESWRIELGHETVAEARSDQPRPFLDISLANLAARFPAGGRLVWKSSLRSEVLAHFSRPLSAQKFTFSRDASVRELSAWFAETPSEVRIKVKDLITGKSVQSPQWNTPLSTTAWLDPDNHVWASLSLLPKDDGAQLHLKLDRENRPTGIWMAEIELRRSPHSDWETLVSVKGEPLPLVVLKTPATPPNTFREKVFWEHFGTGLRDAAFAKGVTTDWRELIEMVEEVTSLLATTYHEKAWAQLEPMRAMFSSLLQQCSWQLGQENEDAQLLGKALLLAVATHTDPPKTRTILRELPDLLALPGSTFVTLLPTTPVRHALASIGRMCSQERYADFIQELLEPFLSGQLNRPPPLFNVLQNFANCSKVLEAGPSGPDFTCFNLGRYFQRTIGIWKSGVGYEPELDEVDVLSALHAHRSLSAAHRALLDQLSGAGIAPIIPALKDWRVVKTQIIQLWSPAARLLQGGPNNPSTLLLEEETGQWLPELNAFVAMWAFAARTAGNGHASFRGMLAPLVEKHGAKTYRQTIRLIHDIAPELMGYYLILWELVHRTTSKQP